MVGRAGIHATLLEVRGIIEENPDSYAARQEVERIFQQVLDQTRMLAGYTTEDFLDLMRLSIFSVGYARKEINDTALLTAVASSVPESLGVEAVFPVVDDLGRRTFWYESDMRLDVDLANHVHGRTAALQILKRFGDYALFLAGMMPDFLLRNSRKNGIDCDYYDNAGSNAFRSIAKAGESYIGNIGLLEELAIKFHDLRLTMNEAGMAIGTAARKTVMNSLMEDLGIGKSYFIGHGPLSGLKPLRDGPGASSMGEPYSFSSRFSNN